MAKNFSDVWRNIFPTFGGNEKDDRNAIVLSNGRGTKARTQKNGFGDRYVTIIPLSLQRWYFIIRAELCQARI